MYKMVVLEQLGHFDWHLTFEWTLSAANRARQGGRAQAVRHADPRGRALRDRALVVRRAGAHDRGMDIWGF